MNKLSIAEVFQLLRWKNLLLLSFTLILFRYTVTKRFVIHNSIIDDTHFFILLCSILLVSAAGYLINDIRDISIDAVNNPSRVLVGKSKVVIKKLNYLYYLLNAIAFILMTDISLALHNGSIFVVYTTAIILLWLYAYKLKKILFIGNLTIASLSALSIITMVLPESSTVILFIAYLLGAFAFLCNLLREYIKDVEDKEGDAMFGVKSIPIVYGVNRSKYYGYVLLSVILILLMIALSFFWQPFGFFAKAYMICLLIVPYCIFFYLFYKAETKTDFRRLSAYNKLLMFFGVCSLFLIFNSTFTFL